MGKEKTIEERITFLTNLELDAPDLGDIPTIPHRLENASAGVDAGSLVTFSGGVTEQNQADVKNSCLLAANKEYDREKQTEQWYRFYAEVLENVGWVIQEFQFSRITSKKGDFEASAIMFEILRAFCTEDEKVAMISCIWGVTAAYRSRSLFCIPKPRSASNLQIKPLCESDRIGAVSV